MLIYKPYIVTIPNEPSVNLTEYFGDPQYFLRRGKLKESLELGSMGHLLGDIRRTKLEEFIGNSNASIDDIAQIGEIIKTYVSVRRNTVAHTESIGVEETKDDREIVYVGDREYGRQVEIRNLFNTVCQLFL